MAIKRKRRRKKRRKKTSSIFVNVIILSLLVVIFGFVGSLFQRLFYNSGTHMLSTANLAEMIASTKYEKNTGHKIEVEVHNGCGVPKLANMYTDFLRSTGYDVLESKNADHFSYNETVILHHNGDKERAFSLANTMGIQKANIVIEDKIDYLHDLTLIVGQDYRKLNSYRKALRYINPY